MDGREVHSRPINQFTGSTEREAVARANKPITAATFDRRINLRRQLRSRGSPRYRWKMISVIRRWPRESGRKSTARGRVGTKARDRKLNRVDPTAWKVPRRGSSSASTRRGKPGGSSEIIGLRKKSRSRLRGRIISRSVASRHRVVDRMRGFLTA